MKNLRFSVSNLKVSMKIKGIKFIDVIRIKGISYNLCQRNFAILSRRYTYIFFRESCNGIIHVNVTKLKNYSEIFTSKKNLCDILPTIDIISLKVDNICSVLKLQKPLRLEKIFNSLSGKYPLKYQTQKFPGLFIKLQHATAILFRTGSVIIVGVKNPYKLMSVHNSVENIILNDISNHNVSAF